jgi:Tol biopolymer transport system component
MADLKVALEDLETETPGPQKRPTSMSRPGFSVRKAALFVAVVSAVVLIALTAMRVFQRSPEVAPQRTVKFTFTPSQLLRGANNEIDAEVSISPDGKHIAYVEWPLGQLWVRDIDQEQARPVPGATSVYQAFWSPDNRYIGYSAGGCFAFVPGCDLVRIPAQGGTPLTIVKLQGGFRRASWSSDGETIVYGEWPHGMLTIPARSGASTLILEHGHLGPSFLDLPDGRRAFLYQAEDADRPGGHGIYVQVAGENQRRFVTMSSSSNPYPAYSPTGHIIYVDGNNDSPAIWALPFSLKTLQPAGKAFPIVQRGSSPMVSRTGTLVYSDVPSNRFQLLWCDRSGKTLSTIGEPQPQQSPALSPDGRRLAVTSRESGHFEIWVYDLDREITTKTRITPVSGNAAQSAWTPSGDEIT